MKVAITVGKLAVPPSHFIADHVRVLGDENTRLACLKFVAANGLPPTHPHTRSFVAGLRMLRSFAPDVVHQHWATWSTMGRLAAKRTGAAFVVGVHGYDAFLPATPGRCGPAVDATKRWERDRALNHADAVVVNSSFMYDRVKELGVEPSRLHIVRHAVDTDAYTPTTQQRCQSILFAGRLSPEKGLDILLRALSLIPEPSRPKLTVLGDGPERAQYEALAASLRLKADFRGMVGKQTVVSALGEYRLVVCPSRTRGAQIEASGIVPLEAQACATPVLTTTAGGLSEGVEPAARAFACDDTPERLAQAIEAIWPHTSALGGDARRYIERHHSLPVMAVALHQVYAAAIARKRKKEECAEHV